MKKMCGWMLGILLAVSLVAAADVKDPRKDALNAAQPGSVFALPAALPSGWDSRSAPLGEATPGWQTWVDQATTGRVLWAYRVGNPPATQKVVAVKRDGQNLKIWSPVRLEGKGWRISDRLPTVSGPPAPAPLVEKPPAPVVVEQLPAPATAERPEDPAAERPQVEAPDKPVAPPVVEKPVEQPAAPLVDVTMFAASVAAATVGDVIQNPPSTCPEGWAELKLHSRQARLAPGQAGALYCETEKRRVPYFVFAVGDEPEGKVTTVWMLQADVDILTGRKWVNVIRRSERAPAVAPTPPSGENGQPGVSAAPPVEKPKADGDKPVGAAPTPPSANPLFDRDWLRPGGLDRRKPGEVVDVTGLDRNDCPPGWRIGAIQDPDPELRKPGLVIVRSEGLSVIVYFSEAPKPLPGRTPHPSTSYHSLTTYWYRKADQKVVAVALPTPEALSTMPVGSQVVLPAGTTWDAPPDGWQHRAELRPFSRAVSLAMPPGTVVELVKDERSVRGVVVEWVYDDAHPEEWIIRLWTVSKPNGAKLRLPPGM